MCVQSILPGREAKGFLIPEFPRRFFSVDVGRVEGLKFVPERNFKNATQLGNVCLAHTSLGVECNYEFNHRGFKSDKGPDPSQQGPGDARGRGPTGRGDDSQLVLECRKLRRDVYNRESMIIGRNRDRECTEHMNRAFLRCPSL